jgi:alkylation response protein AidB-like acyl-CoA dehydrogenase
VLGSSDIRSLDTWFEVVREIGKADASHAWRASLMIHHPHYISQFSEDAQQAVWADGLDLPIAASILPSARVTPVDGGYRISGQFPFASGINHSRWLIVGGMDESGGHPEWTFFLIGPNDFKVVDTWFTGAMRATGSNTAVCDDVFVLKTHTLRLSDLRDGKGPGGKLHALFRLLSRCFEHNEATTKLKALPGMAGAEEYPLRHFRVQRAWLKLRSPFIFLSSLHNALDWRNHASRRWPSCSFSRTF